MIGLFILALVTKFTFASSYEEGLSRIETLQQRTRALMGKAGLAESPGRSSYGRQEDLRPPILQIHALPTSSRIPAGGLAFGKTYLRLLIGDESSPIQVRISEGGRFPTLTGLKALGAATQVRGRVFAEFDRLVTRSGKVIAIKAQLLDRTGALGVKGERENSKLLEIAGGVGLGILASPKEDASPFGFQEVPRQTPSERMKSSLFTETRNYLREQVRETPVLRLDEETGVTLLFKEEVRF